MKAAEDLVNSVEGAEVVATYTIFEEFGSAAYGANLLSQ